MKMLFALLLCVTTFAQAPMVGTNGVIPRINGVATNLTVNERLYASNMVTDPVPFGPTWSGNPTVPTRGDLFLHTHNDTTLINLDWNKILNRPPGLDDGDNVGGTGSDGTGNWIAEGTTNSTLLGVSKHHAAQFNTAITIGTNLSVTNPATPFTLRVDHGNPTVARFQNSSTGSTATMELMLAGNTEWGLLKLNTPVLSKFLELQSSSGLEGTEYRALNATGAHKFRVGSTTKFVVDTSGALVLGTLSADGTIAWAETGAGTHLRMASIPDGTYLKRVGTNVQGAAISSLDVTNGLGYVPLNRTPTMTDWNATQGAVGAFVTADVNGPSPGTFYTGLNYPVAGDTGNLYAMQLAGRYADFRMRTKENGTWLPWETLYHSGSVRIAAGTTFIQSGAATDPTQPALGLEDSRMISWKGAGGTYSGGGFIYHGFGSNLWFGANGATRWLISPDGHLQPWGFDTFDIGSASNRVRAIYVKDVNAGGTITQGGTAVSLVGHTHADATLTSIDWTKILNRPPGLDDGDQTGSGADGTGNWTAVGGSDSTLAGLANAASFRATSIAVPTSGAGLELAYFSGQGIIQGYDRSTNIYRPIKFIGATHTFTIGAADVWIIDANGHLRPIVPDSSDVGAPGIRVRNVYAGGVNTSTSDGGDNSTLYLSGGGGAAEDRGAFIAETGNEGATKGRLMLTAGKVGNGVGDDAHIGFRTGGADRWRFDTNGVFEPYTHNTYDIGENANRVRTVYAGTFDGNLQWTNILNRPPGLDDGDNTGGAGSGDDIYVDGVASSSGTPNFDDGGTVNFTMTGANITGTVKGNISVDSVLSASSIYSGPNVGAATVMQQGQDGSKTVPAIGLNNDRALMWKDAATGSFTNGGFIRYSNGANLWLGSQNADRWYLNSSGHFLPNAGLYNIGSSGERVANLFTTTINNSSTITSSGTVGAGASFMQTGNDADRTVPAIGMNNNKMITWRDQIMGFANAGYIHYDNNHQLVLGTSGANRWHVAANGNFIPNTPDAINIGATTSRVSGIYVNGVNLPGGDVQGQINGKAATVHAHAGEDITSGTVADARIASTLARDSEVDATQTGTHTAPNTTASITISSPIAGKVHTVWQGITGTIVLPPASSHMGKAVLIYNTGSFVITVDPNASEVIVRDGAVQTGGVTMTLSAGAGNYVSLWCDGSRWVTLGYKGTLAVGT